MTNSSLNRRFRWVVDGQLRGPNPNYDVELYGDRDFGVIPTQGSMVPGWVLVVPRQQVLSVTQLSYSKRERATEVLRRVANYVSAFNQQVFFFEHGATEIGSATGCGVDQAHIHVVPLCFDLIRTVRAYGEQEAWTRIDSVDPWAALDISRDYYLMSDFKNAYLAYPQKTQSQFFRRVIASGLRRPYEWDYRAHPHEKIIRETISHFRRSQEPDRAA